jgi:hypothetical protein
MRVTPVVLLLGLLSAGCSDPLGPNPGALRISLSVVGIDEDPDGYEFTVDGRHPTLLRVPGSTTLTISAGRHTVALGELASNCAPISATVQEAMVSPSDTASVAFAVECRAVTSVVEVATVTTGSDVDPNGYYVSLDGGAGRSIWSSGVIHYIGVAEGLHDLALSDLAPNCTVSGPNPRTGIQVATGGLVRDTVHVTFDVACAPTTGAVRIITSTSGTSPDPDGFLVAVAPGMVIPQRLLPNDTLVVGQIPPGAVSVGIGDIALNCSYSGPNPVTWQVTFGVTTEVRFDVVCVTPGIVRVSAPTSGQDLDSSYLVTVDGGNPITLPSNGLVSLDLAPGSRSIELTDIAVNCAVSGSNPVIVNVIAGITTNISFDVICTPKPRTGVEFTITTSGTDLDTGYELTICADYCYWAPSWQGVVLANEVVQVDLPPGGYEFDLSDVAGNCTGPTLGNFAVQQGQVTTVRLDFTCGARTTVRFTAPTTGQIPSGPFYVRTDNGNTTPTAALLPNGSLLLDLAEGSHSFYLFGLPLGCAVLGSNPVTVNLPAATVTDVIFSVNCTAPGTLFVSASTGGTDPDPYYNVEVDGNWVFWLNNGSIGNVRLTGGSHSVLLTDVDGNCTVTSPNPATVSVPSGGTASLVFTVSCNPYPVLRITVSTTGTNLPATYLVGVDDDYYGYLLYSAIIGSNGVASLSVPPGNHTVSLDQVPLNCSVTSPNNIAVTVPMGTTTDVAFSVVCQ